MPNSVAATMGLFLFLTLILQTLIGHLSSAFVIHEDEYGNPVLTFNGSLEDLFPEYYYGNSTALYEYDYSPYEIAVTKVTPIANHGVSRTNSAMTLLLGHLSFHLFLHLLLFLPRGTGTPCRKAGPEMPA